MIITMEFKRKAVSYRIDERVVEALKTMARDKNNSVNNWLETHLIDYLKTIGYLNNDFRPLGETRGGDTKQESTNN